MKDWLINWISGLFGIKRLWMLTDGIKAYLTFSATILTGVSGLLNEFIVATGPHNAAALIAFLQGCIAQHDPAWLIVLSGCAGIAAAHKMAKNTAAVVANTVAVQSAALVDSTKVVVPTESPTVPDSSPKA